MRYLLRAGASMMRYTSFFYASSIAFWTMVIFFHLHEMIAHPDGYRLMLVGLAGWFLGGNVYLLSKHLQRTL